MLLKISDAFTNKGQTRLPREVYKECKQYEFYMVFASLITLLVPVILVLSIFHKADPFHIILEDIFEIKVEFSPKFVLLGLGYAWGGWCLTEAFVIFIFTALFAVTYCSVWVEAITPVEKLERGKYLTKMLGQINSDQIIWVYRTHQVLCNCVNNIIGKFRITVHFAILHIVLIISTFILVTSFDVFVENAEYEALAVFALCAFLCILICFLECTFIGESVDISRNVKYWFVNRCGRRDRMNKVGKSFRTLVVRTTFPLFTVSKETFLEYLDCSFNNLFNLLCF